MAARSTRKLIINKTDCITRELDKAMFYIYEINQLAKGGSPWITSQSPLLAQAIDEVKKAVKLFRAEL